MEVVGIQWLRAYGWTDSPAIQCSAAAETIPLNSIVLRIIVFLSHWSPACLCHVCATPIKVSSENEANG
jgi:hypothetical protein